MNTWLSDCQQNWNDIVTIPFDGTTFLFANKLCMFTDHDGDIAWHLIEIFFVIFCKSSSFQSIEVNFECKPTRFITILQTTVIFNTVSDTIDIFDISTNEIAFPYTCTRSITYAICSTLGDASRPRWPFRPSPTICNSKNIFWKH